jgi:hypothetical protein
MSHSQRSRIVGFVTAFAIFGGLSACGGGNGNGGNNGPTPMLQSITLASGGSVVAGQTIQGTATLTAAARAGGAGVTLSSSNTGVATVPGSVSIPEGAQSANFTVTGVSAGTATITGNFGGAQTATVNVAAAPIDLVSVTLAQTAVSGIGPVQGTVTISGAAPSGGTTVGLSSSNTGAATVPANVTVSQGNTTAVFTVNVITAQANNVTITGTLGSTTRTTSLAINAVPIVANFVMVRDAGSAGSANQCEVVSIALGGGSSGNRMRCSFDASASTPQGGITSYIWRFGTPTGSMAFTRTTPTISGSEFTLPCGSFGTSPPLGSVFDRDVTLEIATPGGNASRTISITFLRNGPCG